jgi:hypothetical protein
MAGIGSAPGIILGVGVGAAAGAALAPAIEVPKQQAWAGAPNRILDVAVLARLVAQGGVDLSDAAAEALLDGYKQDKLDALIYLEQTAPGSGEALSLWRLGLLSDGLFEHALTKAGLDPRFAAAIIARKTAEPLGLGDIAYGVVRGILPAPSWVPVAPPAHGDKVPRFPVVNEDPVKLAELIGYDEEALKIMVGRSGLSMAPGMAAQALFREIIGPNDYTLAIAEGDLRTEWAESLLEVSRAIPTPGEAVEGYLRGWISQAEMYAQTARHGMSQADTDLVFDIKGRPVAVHQITTGLARGGVYPSSYDAVPEPYRKALQESDIRPEWASIAYANRYTYPSAFVMRSLAEAGDLGDTAAVAQLLEEIGWKPSLAAKVAAKWVPAGATGDPHIGKARTQLWTATHSSYIKEEIGVADATAALETAGVDPGSVAGVLAVWDAERALIRKQLTPTQIRKAVNGAVTNPATSQPWSHADAIAALLARGYDQADAQTFMAEG